jgi:uncharacterized protein YkwD
MFRLLIPILILTLGACGAVATTTLSGDPGPTISRSLGAAQVGSGPDAIRYLQRERTSRGSGLLAYDAGLAAVALARAEAMAATGSRAAGDARPLDRARAAGIDACWAEEAIAAGPIDLSSALRVWLARPRDAQRVLAGRAEIGAVAQARDGRGRLWWALVLAERCQGPVEPPRSTAPPPG